MAKIKQPSLTLKPQPALTVVAVTLVRPVSRPQQRPPAPLLPTAHTEPPLLTLLATKAENRLRVWLVLVHHRPVSEPRPTRNRLRAKLAPPVRPLQGTPAAVKIRVAANRRSKSYLVKKPPMPEVVAAPVPPPARPHTRSQRQLVLRPVRRNSIGLLVISVLLLGAIAPEKVRSYASKKTRVRTN